MKITFTTLLILGSLFLTGKNLYAQTPAQRAKIIEKYDLRKLEELRVEFKKYNDENLKKALEMAKINNWPLEVTKENGAFSQLVGLTEEGIPLYLTTTNNGAAITSRASKLQPGGSLGLNLAGQNMFIGVWDGGKIRNNHLDFGNRVYVFDNTSKPVALHPTHVAGTIISSGVNGTSNNGRGVAYQANAWYSDWDYDVTEMTSAAGSGMILSNHSYGMDPDAPTFSDNLFGAYIQKSKQIDDLMFTAPQYQVVVAAGNDRNDAGQFYNSTKGGYDLITSMGTSKNAIVVAAVNGVSNYTGPASVVMSGFSNYGPTDDGRIKPDIATKGVAVYSTSNSSNTAYINQSGTSMASPNVAGTLLLVQQHYSNKNDEEFMNASTLKGLMTHTADEAGLYDGPDPRFGWGLINAEKMVLAINNEEIDEAIISELTLSQGVPYVKQVQAKGTEKLVATIAWTDRGGATNSSAVDLSTPVLVNDLDIRITKDGTTHFPWKLDELPTDPAYKGDNSVDNIEKIEIDNPSSVGNYTITVTNKGNLVSGVQNFSLIVTGIQSTLSTDDSVADKMFQVWPNPAKDLLNITFKSANVGEDALVEVFDIQGRMMMRRNISEVDMNSVLSLDVNELKTGMYFVNVSHGKNQSSSKFLKK